MRAGDGDKMFRHYVIIYEIVYVVPKFLLNDKYISRYQLIVMMASLYNDLFPFLIFYQWLPRWVLTAEMCLI